MGFEIYKKRVERFQKLLKEKGIPVAMIRDSYAFRYFAGVDWDPPAMMVPAEGEPVIFAIEDEIPELSRLTWIERIEPYREVRKLITTVHNLIDRDVIGFNLDIDSSAALFRMFTMIHRQRRIEDVHMLIMQLRMEKDQEEVELIRKAGEIAAAGMEAALKAAKPGVSELDIAAEAEYAMRKAGAERIFVYVNSGGPRVHARPRAKKVKDYVLIDLMPSYRGYYYDMARTVLFRKDEQRLKALKAMEALHRAFPEMVQEGLSFHKLEQRVETLYSGFGLEKEYIYGFGHGVGLRFEEAPILTIVPGHRMLPVKPSMTISVGHAPLTGPELGTIKIEDTWLLKKEGAERLSSFPLLIDV